MTTPRPRPEALSTVSDSLAHPVPEPVPGRDDLLTPGVERRLEDVVSTIVEFAALKFDARASVGLNGDMIDAVSHGVNYLGEELEASFNEIERRVADRTAELAVATKELSRRALHDELTGLPNRALLWDRLSHRLSSADRRQTGFAVLFLDVDHFKTINDTLGHAAGDRLLIDVAQRIRDTLRGSDTAARVGGDEFVVLLDDVATKEAALAIAERLGEALTGPYQVGSGSRVMTSSIGVAVGPVSVVAGSDAVAAAADAVVAAADAAMYKAKRHGEGGCVLNDGDPVAQPGLLPAGDA